MTKKFLNEIVASAHKLQNRVRIAGVARVSERKCLRHSFYASLCSSTHAKDAKASAIKARRTTATIHECSYACSCNICVYVCIFVHAYVYTPICFCATVSELVYLSVCVCMSASSSPSRTCLRFTLHLRFGLLANQRLHLHLQLHLHLLTSTRMHLHIHPLPSPYLHAHVCAFVLASASASASPSGRWRQ